MSAIVFFDGVCNLCNTSVQFILKRDPKGYFRFAPLQSDLARELAGKHGVDAEKLDGLVLIENDVASTKSTASLRIARRLSWPWPLAAAFLIVPRIIRDWFYDRFAERRYRWFGKLDACPIPTAADLGRFLA